MGNFTKRVKKTKFKFAEPAKDQSKITRMGVGQFAKECRKSRFTVYIWIKNGGLPPGVAAVNIAGRIILEVDEDFRNE